MRIPEELRTIVDESVTACHAHVIDLVLRGDPRKPVVEVFVDTEDGVSTDLCSDISRRIAAGVDAGGFLAESYRLEVSSPGIDRPLLHSWQYVKHVGRDLNLKVNAAPGAGIEVRGTLLVCDDAGVTLRTAAGGEQQVAFADIREAKVMPPW
jgi:ribosome maturation factor RimP